MFADFLIPPALIMLAGAFIIPILPSTWRQNAFLFFPLAALIAIMLLPDSANLTFSFLRYELILLDVTRLTRIFGLIFALIALINGIYAHHMKEPGQQSAALLYAGGALGLTFAGDYFTLFIFWELMAVASTYLVWARRTTRSEHAGMRYLLVHLFGGSLLLLGIILQVHETGSLQIVRLIPDMSLSSWLILGGVALNTAIPPLHAWIADAYPEGTITGSVFLNAFTTKSAVLILIKIFAGWEILIFLGVMMTLYGVIYAILANDIRSILSYHIISQVGYMVTGVGIGTELALNGSVAFAVSNILYKSLMFMGAGAVIHATGKSKLSELGGLAGAMPITLWLYMVGAFSISGFPLFNGFTTKSIIISAAGYAHQETVMLLLLLASVGTFLSVGLKLPYFTWWSKAKENHTVNPVPQTMHLAMALVAFFCILFGVYPWLLYAYLPFEMTYNPFYLYHFMESAQILAFTFIAFWIVRKKLEPKPYMTIDTDWFYRKSAPLFKKVFVDAVWNFFEYVETLTLKLVNGLSAVSKNPFILSKTADTDYDPDRNRLMLQFSVMFIVITAILVSVFSLT